MRRWATSSSEYDTVTHRTMPFNAPQSQMSSATWAASEDYYCGRLIPNHLPRGSVYFSTRTKHTPFINSSMSRTVTVSQKQRSGGRGFLHKSEGANYAQMRNNLDQKADGVNKKRATQARLGMVPTSVQNMPIIGFWGTRNESLGDSARVIKTAPLVAPGINRLRSFCVEKESERTPNTISINHAAVNALNTREYPGLGILGVFLLNWWICTAFDFLNSPNSSDFCQFWWLNFGLLLTDQYTIVK